MIKEFESKYKGYRFRSEVDKVTKLRTGSVVLKDKEMFEQEEKKELLGLLDTMNSLSLRKGQLEFEAGHMNDNTGNSYIKTKEFVIKECKKIIDYLQCLEDFEYEEYKACGNF